MKLATVPPPRFIFNQMFFNSTYQGGEYFVSYGEGTEIQKQKKPKTKKTPKNPKNNQQETIEIPEKQTKIIPPKQQKNPDSLG